jgi:hypothetical protein
MSTTDPSLPSDSAEHRSAGTIVLELPLQTAGVRLQMGIANTIIGLLAAIWTTIFTLRFGLIGSVAALPGLLLMGIVVYYWRRYAEHFTCRLLADGLLVRRGVWWRSEVFVPRSRIQHTEVNQGPLARHNDLAQIAVFTAGSHASKIEIDGLALTDATQLRDQLLGRDGHDAL